MNQLDSILEVQKRAKTIRKTASNEHDIYLHAIHDFVSDQRQTLNPDAADRLQTYLLRKFGLE